MKKSQEYREELLERGIKLAREGRNRKAIEVLESAKILFSDYERKDLQENFEQPEQREKIAKLAIILEELSKVYYRVFRVEKGRLYSKDSQRLLRRLEKN